jgi:hypothetical protein
MAPVAGREEDSVLKSDEELSRATVRLEGSTPDLSVEEQVERCARDLCS